MQRVAGNRGPVRAKPGSVVVKQRDYSVRFDVVKLHTFALTPPLLGAAEASKDGWDKLAAVSGLISAVLVAAIGAAATIVYNRRQRAAESSERDRELRTSEAQTVASFLPHLHSSDTKEKEAALVAMSALGNTELVTKLARIYQDDASVGALSKIASGADPKAKRLAEESLEQILGKAVVKIDHEEGITTGFCVAPKTIVTWGGTAEDVEAKQTGSLTTSEGDTCQVAFVNQDRERMIKVFRADVLPLKTLRLLEPDASVEELGELAVLGWGGQRGWHYGFGSLEDGQISDDRGADLVAKLETEPGFAGAPVVDRLGRVVGMHYASVPWAEGEKKAMLISAEAIRLSLREMGIDLE
jgi:hypothetical protein